VHDLPGPGTYPAAGAFPGPSAASHSARGSGSFASASTRLPRRVKYTGPGPGAYPAPGLAVTATAHDFNRSRATSSFAGKAPRLGSPRRGASPGRAGVHTAPDLARALDDSESEGGSDGGGRGRGRGFSAAVDDVPGPAAYAPPPVSKRGTRIAPLDDARLGHVSSFRNTGHVFPVHASSAPPPASYELVKPWVPEPAADAGPPPGAGRTHSPLSSPRRRAYPSFQMRRALSSAEVAYGAGGAIVGFSRSNSRVQAPPGDAPGPGAYEPDVSGSLAAGAARALARGGHAASVAAKRAAGPQAPPLLQARQLSVIDRINVQQHALASGATPGPGAYDARALPAIDPDRGTRSGFVSGVQRGEALAPRGGASVPGPAYYEAPKALRHSFNQQAARRGRAPGEATFLPA
jgi:hypothetical protein